jgi:hypothetical protein
MAKSWMRHPLAALGGAAIALGAAALPSIGWGLVFAGGVLLAISVRSGLSTGEALIAAGAVWLAVALANNDTSCLPRGDDCTSSASTAWSVLSAIALAVGICAAAWSFRARHQH